MHGIIILLYIAIIMAVVFIFHKVSVHEYSITVTAMVIIITGILPIYGCGQTAIVLCIRSLCGATMVHAITYCCQVPEQQ